MVHTDYTEAELRDAWAQARLRSWPPTFEEAMADPARSRLVRLAAMRLARGECLQPPRIVRRPALVRPDLHTPPALGTPSLPARLDRKRSAAGERDDD